VTYAIGAQLQHACYPFKSDPRLCARVRDGAADVVAGGFFAIIDHAAPAGTGDAYARDFKGKHRIDEALVRQKLIAGGFRLDAESQLLRNPDDDRTKAFFDPEMKGKNTDKFALLFHKP
jgi:predicted methyltransferase